MQRAVPILPTRAMAQAIAYYQRLGFHARQYQDADEYAFLSRGNLELHLRHAPDCVAGHSPSGVYFYLEPGTASSLEAEFRAADVAILSPLAVRVWSMNEFMLSDPDGNLLRFGEPA